MERLSTSLREALSRLFRLPVIDEAAVKEFIRDIQRALLTADVNVSLVFELSKRVEEKALKEKVPPGLSRREVILKTLYEELLRLLGGESVSLTLSPGKSHVIMLVGIQGSGKTTSAAKLAYYFKKRGFKPALVCADNFRPAAYEQLLQLGQKAGVPVYGDPSLRDAVKLASKGVQAFKERGFDLIIVDTSGRHKEEKGLIEEMRLISEAIMPDEIMLVIDATIGQQASIQAKAFNEATSIGSIFLTKLDGSAKGGGALSAVAAIKARIKFVGTGEKLDEIELFDPRKFVSRLLGMGDLQTLVEKVKELEQKADEERLEALMSGKITLKDMLAHIESVKKLGPMRKILELIPGVSLKVPSELADLADEKLARWGVIIKSMTEEEAKDPSIIDRSRMRRIAKGSGVKVKDVKELIDQFNLAKKTMRQLMRRAKRLQQFPLHH
ncbi:MAG: signal recognition particle protein Srp54 [Candidatus Nezhaarchaeales archaeon]